MEVDYHAKYKFLKRKLKILAYEHEGLTHELEKSQRKLLKVARDNSFLLDRLLQYEPVALESPYDSDMTLSSESETEGPPPKKRSNVPSTAKALKNEQADKMPLDQQQKDTIVEDNGNADSPNVLVKEETVDEYATIIGELGLPSVLESDPLISAHAIQEETSADT